MQLRKFANSNLEKLPDSERQRLLNELSDVLTERVLKASDFDKEISTIVRELQDLGHQLYLYDSDGDFTVWLGNWIHPEGRTKLILYFYPDKGVEAEWSNPE